MRGLAEAVSWEDADHADGPGIAAFFDRVLAERGLNTNSVSDSFARRMWDWRNGCRAGFWTLDGYLTKLGLHPSDAPDNVWRRGPARGPAKCWNCGTRPAIRCCEYGANGPA